MSDLYEEYGLEIEEDLSIAESPSTAKKPAPVKKSGGWLRTIIALGLGVVVGAGGVIGGGFLALNTPVRPALEFLGGFADIDYEKEIQNKLLSEEYEDKTVLEILAELATVLEDKNLVGVNNIVPALGEYLLKMTNKLES